MKYDARHSLQRENPLMNALSAWFVPAPDSRISAIRQQGKSPWAESVHLLWSAWVFVSKRHNGRSALANVLIAAGVLVAALGGTAAFTGTEDIVQWTNFVGVLLIFIGFLII